MGIAARTVGQAASKVAKPFWRTIRPAEITTGSVTGWPGRNWVVSTGGGSWVSLQRSAAGRARAMTAEVWEEITPSASSPATARRNVAAATGTEAHHTSWPWERATIRSA